MSGTQQSGHKDEKSLTMDADSGDQQVAASEHVPKMYVIISLIITTLYFTVVDKSVKDECGVICFLKATGKIMSSSLCAISI